MVGTLGGGDTKIEYAGIHLENDLWRGRLMLAIVQSMKYTTDKVEEYSKEMKAMAFVNELIPEAEKEKFTFPVHSNKDGSKPTLWKWTIDRERDAFLVMTNKGGGGYDGSPNREYFVLSWKDQLVHFGGDRQITGNDTLGLSLWWKIHYLSIPESLKSCKEEVLQLIQEALDEMGLLYRRDRVVMVKVDFSSSSSTHKSN